MSTTVRKNWLKDTATAASAITARAARMLIARGAVTAPGMCWAWVRRDVVEPLGLPTPGAGKDAKGAGRWYESNGFAVDANGWENSKPGDIIFWYDGLHGHVAVRIPGNKVAENSSVHSTNGSDARGTRMISDLRKPDLVVRLWRA